MPMFDFECRACGNRYEAMSRYGEKLPACPACAAEDVEKIPAIGTLRSALPGTSWENPRYRGIDKTVKKAPK